MEYIVNGLLILLLGTLYFFAIRYLLRKGTCAGCSSCKSHREVSSCFTVSEGCGGCCAHCTHCTRCGSSPQDGPPIEEPHRS